MSLPLIGDVYRNNVTQQKVTVEFSRQGEVGLVWFTGEDKEKDVGDKYYMRRTLTLDQFNGVYSLAPLEE